MKCKAFDQILREISFRPEKVKKWLEDKRLAQVEKKIISAFMLIRNNQNEKVIEELLGLPESPIEFVNAYKMLLLGLSHNNISSFSKSKEYLEKAIIELGALGLTHYLFIARYNLFIVLSNLSKLPEMNGLIEEMKLMPHSSEITKQRLLMCQFIYAEMIDDIEAANITLEKIEKRKDSMVESDLISHLVNEFMFYIKCEKLELAQQTLSEMKSHRKFHLTENYNFMKKLLDHLAANIPVYVYENDFSSMPFLHHQLKVIHYLESKDISSAELHWQNLQQIAPRNFKADFKYEGSKCLFSLCLKKHLGATLAVEPKLELDGTKEQMLISLLQNSQVPVSKAHIYEALWGEPLLDKEDLRKLTRLVSRIRSEHGLDIETRKGTYLLVSEKKLKVG